MTTWDIAISNVAGIRSGSATIEPGVNAIRGNNWQGKSSFVTAVETVMGTETVLTEGEETGRVELSTDGRTVTVDLVREDGTVRRNGTPVIEDEKTRVAASLYSFLDDDNDLRNAVQAGENLESYLTRPLDFENFDEQIADLDHERSQVEAEIERAQDAADRLPTVQETVEDLETELKELEERRAAFVEQNGGDVATSTQRDELSDAKAERDSVAAQIDRLERTVERTREKLDDRRSELAEIQVPTVADDLQEKIEESETRHRGLDRDAELLQSIYAPTRRIIDEDRLDLITDLERDLVADTVSCWTCGNETTREGISENLEVLGERISELRSDAAEHRRRVDELRERREAYERASRRTADLESEISTLESTLEERETSLERSHERLGALESRIEELSATVAETSDELTDLESQIKYTETRLGETRDELTDLETRVDQRDRLQEEYDALTEEIRDLRDRKERVKRRTREAFDDAIRDVISRFDVSFEMVRLTSNFELVVARDGREADLDALSEGELELLGIVACLAGHEAFDVTDDVPFMLLDGLGGLADENLRTLIEYLGDRVEYLLFTTYPENTTFEGNTIDPNAWTVVSPDSNRVSTSG